MQEFDEMGAECRVMTDGVWIDVESPDSGELACVNLTKLVEECPPAVRRVFDEWSAYHVGRFKAAQRAAQEEISEAPDTPA